MSGHATISILLILMTALSTVVAPAQQPQASLTRPVWTRGCVGSRRAPAVAFSPDNRVISILFDDFQARIDGKPGAKKLTATRSCTFGFDLIAPAGYRPVFRAAQYSFATVALGSSTATVEVRHGLKHFFRRWSQAIVVKGDADESSKQAVLTPRGPVLTGPCGRKVHFLIELRAKVSASGPNAAARAEVDSVDFDSGIEEQLLLESCSIR